MFAAVVLFYFSLGGEFIPKLEGDFAVDTRVLTGDLYLPQFKSTQQAAHILLQRFPEVPKWMLLKISGGEIPTDPMPIEASDVMVVLNQKEWTSAKHLMRFAEKMSKALEDVPGINVWYFQFPVQMRFNELMTGGRQDVICKIFWRIFIPFPLMQKNWEVLCCNSKRN